MIFYVTTYLGSLHDIISKTWTSCLSAFRFGGYRRRWESNLKLQSVPNRNMKGFKMYYSLLCLYFSLLVCFRNMLSGILSQW
jgi:hypothetical protein